MYYILFTLCFVFLFNYFIFFSLGLFGIIIIICLLLITFDLKKIIAISSIIHLNFCFIGLCSISYAGIISSIIISFSHGFSSIGLFLFIGLLSSLTGSRFIDTLFYLNYDHRLILFFFLLINISFPSSFNFIGEIISLIAIVDISSFLCLLCLLSSFISTLYFILILNRKLPYISCYLAHFN